tara:strand:+ start:569 stop:685 length:117 start_codon:yes stop_codon:yes gene_type:complete
MRYLLFAANKWETASDAIKVREVGCATPELIEINAFFP